MNNLPDVAYVESVSWDIVRTFFWLNKLNVPAGNAIVNLSTNLLESSVDTVVVQIDNEVFVTGSQITTNTGTVVIGIGVQLTGVSMTASTGNPIIFGWAVVDINVTNTWSVVDIAA